MDVRQSNTGRSVASLQQNGSMNFEVMGLEPGSTYTIGVRTRNKFGTSEPTYFSLVTTREPEKQLAETKVKDRKEMAEENKLFPIVLGAGVTLILLMVVILLTGDFMIV